jgi:hypothetical protein
VECSQPQLQRRGDALRVGLVESSFRILAQVVAPQLQVCQHAADKKQAQKSKIKEAALREIAKDRPSLILEL